MVENLVAPVNHLAKVVDEIFPIAIPINVGDLINNKGLTTYLGKAHPGVPAGLSFVLDGNDIANLLNNLLGGIAIKGKPLGIKLNLSWLDLAEAAGADADNDGKVDFADSKLDPAWDIFNGKGYKNLKGDRGDTFVTLIKTALTPENWEAIKEATGLNLGDFESIVENIIANPESLINILVQLIGGGAVSYIPVQNRDIVASDFDYSKYLALTEGNADIIAANLDSIINRILKEAGLGNSLKDFIANQFITNETLNSLIDMIVGLLAGDSISGILGTVAGLAKAGENGEAPLIQVGVLNADGSVKEVRQLDLDFTVTGFADKYDNYANHSAAVAAKLHSAATWKDVGSFAGTDWGFRDGDIKGFINALASVLNPLNGVLELLLMGDDKQLSLLADETTGVGAVNIKGGNGYDYAIIPLLEAFGLAASEVKTQAQYEAAVNADGSQLMGYILERVATFAESLLNTPIDKLLTILPNLAYFISNEGIFLIVRNLIAPIYSILGVLGVDLMEVLDLNKLLGGINIPIQLLGAKYGFSIPEIDFYKLASQGAEEIREVATSRSQAANSFVNSQRIKNADDLAAYIKTYPSEPYGSRANKTTQTYVKADKGDTLTLVLTWALKMFGSPSNREALVQFLVQLFDLQDGAETTVRYAINKLFDTADENGVAELIVAALFEMFGIGIMLDATLSGDIKAIQEIYEMLFGALASNGSCSYASIAKVMQDITGVWNDTVGDHEDYEDATEEAEESLNWFQRLIAKIKAFFAKIFGIFK